MRRWLRKYPQKSTRRCCTRWSRRRSLPPAPRSYACNGNVRVRGVHPYRVDGTPVITPDGVNMVQAESYGALRRCTADDCDGSAANNVAVINAAVEAEKAMPGHYPHLRALANSIGTHYVFG